MRQIQPIAVIEGQRELMASLPKVAILMCTFQGQRFLHDQLASFEAQSLKAWTLLVSDDGSSDNTLDILENQQRKWGRGKLVIRSGPRQGFSANFLSLTCQAEIKADFYAYADQDDVWEADKLDRAVNWLKTIPEDVPALYCSRTKLIDENNRTLGFSPLFKRPPNFANALMQNIGGGNTMVFNQATKNLLCRTSKDIQVVSHDWWTYILITGAGGIVFYDKEPTVLYRQHRNNLIGMNTTWLARLKRIRLMWLGCFRDWNNSNVQALQDLEFMLTSENLITLGRFVKARKSSLIPRLIYLKSSGIYRQTLLGNLGLLVAAILGKL